MSWSSKNVFPTITITTTWILFFVQPLQTQSLKIKHILGKWNIIMMRYYYLHGLIKQVILNPPESSWPQCSEAPRRTWGWCWRGQSFKIALFFTVYEMLPCRLLLVPRDEMVNSQELSFIYLVKEVYHLDWNKISLFLRIFHIEPQLVVVTLLTFTRHVPGC